jgi:hypothetical protein
MSEAKLPRRGQGPPLHLGPWSGRMPAVWRRFCAGVLARRRAAGKPQRVWDELISQPTAGQFLGLTGAARGGRPTAMAGWQPAGAAGWHWPHRHHQQHRPHFNRARIRPPSWHLVAATDPPEAGPGRPGHPPPPGYPVRRAHPGLGALRTVRAHPGLADAPPPQHRPRKLVQLTGTPYVAGGHRDSPSPQGARVSGYCLARTFRHQLSAAATTATRSC